MTEPTVHPRVHYFDKQHLRRQDFADEQSYQVAMRRRHNLVHHSWGIVVGLELAIEEGLLVVRPGMAIDGYGRELLLVAKRLLNQNEFLRLGSNRLDVWLSYENTQGGRPPAGYVACGNGESDNYYRTNETPRLIVERAGVSRINAARPKVVPTGLLDSPPQLKTTDDPLAVWPIYIGRITLVPEEPDPEKQILIDATDRKYAGVMAEVIDHPASPARIELGKSSRQDDQREVGDTTYIYKQSLGDRAFAIFVPPQNPSEVELAPRFEIDVDGKNFLRGASTIYGNLQMARGSAVQFIDAVEVDDTVPRDQPSIYRAADNGSDELRIDLGSLVQQSRVFVVGFTAEDGSFQVSLKLEYAQPLGANAPQPLVTIYGDLKMEGLLESPHVLDRSLNSETVNALLSSFQAGTIAAGGQ